MTNKLDVYRAGAIISSFDIDSSTIFNEKLQGTRLISCPISTIQNIDIQEEDYIIFEGEEFSVNLLSDREKDGATLSQKISVNFEAAFYKLLDVYVKSSLGAKKFSLYGTALEHCQMIANAANQVGSGWVVAEVDNTDPLNIDYDFTYVRTALDQIAEAFNLEWDVKGKAVRMVKTIGRDTGLIFELGRGKGLHQIKRSPDASKSVVTRVYGQGGTRNISSKYRNGLQKNLIFEGEYVQTPGVTAGTQRVKEGRYTNENIFPQFKGTITATTVLRDSANKIISTTITDTSIDFNINNFLQEGVKAKVSFLTGILTGNEFEIEKYVHSTRTITLVNSTDTNGYIRPNDLNLPEIGNKFTLYDMNMPVEYVTRAEGELKTETQAFLDQNKLQRLLYGAKPDPKVLRGSNTKLRAGDRATVKDTGWAVNELLRFTEITFPLVNRFDITAIIGNEIRYDKTVKLIADVLQANKQVQDVDRKSEILAKRGVQNLRAFELSVFNPDGKLNADRYDVGVLTTLLAIIGTKSQNFRLNKVYITDNFGGNANSVSISLGELVHFEYANPGNQNIWQLQPVVQSGLISDKLYYVYCKCSKTNQSGTFVITTEQIKPEDIAGFWMFLAGVIYPVLDGYRNSDFTNGIADITAARIKIGKIISRDGLTGFDLDNSTIFGKINFRSSAGSLKDVKDVDTAATNALTNAATAQTAANNAQSSATTANNLLANIADDNLLMPDEKQDVLKEWQIIQSEKPIVNASAGTYSIATNAYDTAYNMLNTYITPLLVSMTANSVIVGATFRANFKAYYDGKIALLKLISDKAKQIADAAQTSANTAISNAAIAQTAANNAQNSAINAQTDASAANQLLADIANDNLLTPSEKQDILKEWQIIQGEKPVVTAQAVIYSLATLNYDNSYNALNTYITPLLISLTTNSVILGATFRTNFKTYYDAKVALLKLISDKAKQLADDAQAAAGTAIANASNAQTAANNAQTSANTANQLLADIANDNLLTPSEKQDVLKEWQIIQSEKPIVNASAGTYSIATATYDTAYNSLNTYVTPLLVSMTTNTTIVATTFRATFKTYYDAKIALLKLINDAAKGLVDNIQFGGTNLLSGGNFEALPVFETVFNCTPKITDEYGGIKAKIGSYFLFTTNLGNSTVLYFQMPKITVSANTQYTISFYAILPYAANTLNITLAYSNGTYSTIPVTNLNIDGLWGKRSGVTFTTPAGVTTVAIRFDATTPAWFLLDGLKIELGNKAGDWSPSFNDVQNGIDKTVGEVKIGAVNLLKNYTNLIFSGTDYSGGSSIIKTSSGSYLITTLTNLNFNNYRFIGADLSISIIGGKQYTLSFRYKLVNGNLADFGAKLSVFQSNQTLVQSGYLPATATNWGVISLTFTTIDSGNIALIIGGSGYAGNTVEYSTIQIEEGNKATTIKPSPEDVASDAAEKASAALVQANAFADSVATTKANAAQANALSGASNDAQTKANNAYNTAVAASNTYANTVSNSAASAAQTAAAADASNKATTAYNNAVTAANTAYNNLTGQLKTMAYRSIALAAAQGVTTIDNGSVVTFSVDAAYIRANVINVGYITGLDLNFIKGTIGGISIQNNAIASSNGLFSVTSAGLLTASNANITGAIKALSGNIAGFNISGDSLTKGQPDTPGSNYVNIAPGSFKYQKTWAGGGGSGIEFNGFAIANQQWAVSILNSRVTNELNVGLVTEASGSSYRNVALWVGVGDIMVDNDLGKTFIQNIGGGFGLKFIKGICVGAVGV